jgi:hypothetical protein
MIKTDIIREERHENDSEDGDANQGQQRDTSDDGGGNEDDYLDI